MRKPQSLRAQAVIWLSQREHSARELRAKLLRRLDATKRRAADEHAVGTADAESSAGGSAVPAAPTDPCRDVGSRDEQVDAVIGWLTERGYLDEQRFVASRIHVRADRFGVARIEQELSRHGLDLPPDAVKALRSTELERAQSIWQRRFGSPPADLRDAARQARFLAGRGFSGEVIRRVVPHLRAAVDPEPGTG